MTELGRREELFSSWLVVLGDGLSGESRALSDSSRKGSDFLFLLRRRPVCDFTRPSAAVLSAVADMLKCLAQGLPMCLLSCDDVCKSGVRRSRTCVSLGLT